MKQNKNYENTDIALTPWQQECETKIVRNGLSEREAELLRSVYEMKHAIDSRQHWAGDNYTQYLSKKAEERMNSIPLNT